MPPRARGRDRPPRPPVRAEGIQDAESRARDDPVERDIPPPPIAPITSIVPPAPTPVPPSILGPVDMRLIDEIVHQTIGAQDPYRKPGDMIEHAKKCGAFDFRGVRDSAKADRWIRLLIRLLIHFS